MAEESPTQVFVAGVEMSGEELAVVFREEQPAFYADMLRHVGRTHTWYEYITYVMRHSTGIPYDGEFWKLAARVARHVEEQARAA